jgi:biotin carboxyl carrier protein
MPRRSLLSYLKWPLALVLLASLFAVAYVVHNLAREERSKEPDAGPRRANYGVVKLSPGQVRDYQIEDAEAREVPWRERVVVYGRVVHNPRAAGEVRVALAGTLRADAKSWPALGETVARGQPLGWVEVRVGPQERLDLQSKLREAQVKMKKTAEEVQIQQSRVKSLKTVTSQELIARDALDAALVQLAQAETQLALAAAAVDEWQKAKDAIDDPKQGSTWRQPLTAPLAGQVVELTAAPGMSLEAGALVARVVDSGRPLVRVDLPPQVALGGPPATLQLFADAQTVPAFTGIHSSLAPPSSPPLVQAVRPRPAPQVDMASQFIGYWYEVEQSANTGRQTALLWRPGLFVKGYVEVAEAKPRPGMAVPLTALLYHQGRPLVYVRISEDEEPSRRYERREVQVFGRQGDFWILLADGRITAGERVVSRGAQWLLSEEFRGEADND